MVGIAPVPPDRLPGELPPGLDFPLVITVQTDGATNFDEPVAACFPNLPNLVTQEILAPGAKTALWSFDHDIGEFRIIGQMTVTDDGLFTCTNPGVGILAPGWHGTWPDTAPDDPDDDDCKFPPCKKGNGSGNGDGDGDDDDGSKKPCNKDLEQCEDTATWGIVDCAASIALDAGLSLAKSAVCAIQGAVAGAEVARDCVGSGAGFGSHTCLSSVGTNTGGLALSCIGKGIPVVVTVVTCEKGIIDSLDDCGCSDGRMPRTPSEVEHVYDIYIEYLEALDEYSMIIRGTAEFSNLDVSQSPIGQNLDRYYAIGDLINASTTPGSDGGMMITVTEEAAITSLPLPHNFSGLSFLFSIEYVNRTVEFHGNGVFTHKAAGRTDFMDRDMFHAAIDRLEAAILAFETIETGEKIATPFNPQDIDLSVFMLGLLYRFMSEASVVDNPAESTIHTVIQDLVTGTIYRGIMVSGGEAPVASLPPERSHRIFTANIAENRYSQNVFITREAGQVSPVRPPYMTRPEASDLDSDGLVDNFEFVVGAGLNNPDSDDDGINDLAEILNGTDPLDNRPQQIGVLGAVDTPDVALDVCTCDEFVVVADSQAGVSVFNIFNGMDPVIVSQFKTPGGAMCETGVFLILREESRAGMPALLLKEGCFSRAKGGAGSHACHFEHQSKFFSRTGMTLPG
jgi:hypothetical protein